MADNASRDLGRTMSSPPKEIRALFPTLLGHGNFSKQLPALAPEEADLLKFFSPSIANAIATKANNNPTWENGHSKRKR